MCLTDRYKTIYVCASGSVGGARPCQGRGRGFESRLALFARYNTILYMREWLSWWSTTLPRSGPRVRVPSRAFLQDIIQFYICASGSVGGARPCQGRGRGFESRLALLLIVAEALILQGFRSFMLLWSSFFVTFVAKFKNYYISSTPEPIILKFMSFPVISLPIHPSIKSKYPSEPECFSHVSMDSFDS